ncbi:hypothetical protein QWY28_20720 [Nocardioides sp. SOB77]|uniref:DUF2726 domain-containing protein n=1 Tax=Nocardioides oceani TaxID=3058369 RepID=A0ABT8FL41_9ACTN|nr:hypothetical protein [Nocardioides oceani]MDN4175398.1 hypothetical protein [Nocardioides oceani]
MPEPLQVVLSVVGLIAFFVVGTLVILRLASSPSDRAVARTKRRAEGARADVAAAAGRHGWHVRTGPAADRPFPADLAMTYAEPRSCDQVVEGRRPLRFTAETWTMGRRNAGSAVAVPVRQHLTHVVPPNLTRPLPRFAVARGRLLAFAPVNLPDDLVRAENRRIDEAQVWGDDQGLAEWLRPVLPALVDAEVWLVVGPDRLVLSREGELDEDGLLARLALAQQVVAAVEAADAAGR